MKENEKEREDMSLKKSKLRTDFIDAHMNSDYLVIDDLQFRKNRLLSWHC